MILRSFLFPIDLLFTFDVQKKPTYLSLSETLSLNINIYRERKRDMDRYIHSLHALYHTITHTHTHIQTERKRDMDRYIHSLHALYHTITHTHTHTHTHNTHTHTLPCMGRGCVAKSTSVCSEQHILPCMGRGCVAKSTLVCSEHTNVRMLQAHHYNTTEDTASNA